jgi:hypothetical protein
MSEFEKNVERLRSLCCDAEARRIKADALVRELSEQMDRARAHDRVVDTTPRRRERRRTPRPPKV